MSQDMVGWHIYALQDSRDGSIRYVGRTTNTVKRLREHRLRPRYYNDALAQWIASVGKALTLVTLESGAGAGFGEAEVKWVRHYRDADCELLNKTEGGDGFAHLTVPEEMREKLKAARKLRGPISEETRKLMAEACRNRPITPEFCAKMREVRRNQPPMTDQTRAKIAEGQRNQSAEMRLKRSIAGKNRPPMTKETRAKLSAASKGRKMPREAVERIAASHRGRKFSDEHKAKLKAARALRAPVSDETRAKMSAAHTAVQWTDERRQAELARIDAGRAGVKLAPEDVRKIRELYRPRKFTAAKLAQMFNVSVATIKAVLSRKIWSHVE